MFSKLRSRLTYANITSSIALFVALGGGAAYAANEWGSANIRDNTLESRDLKDNAGVKSADVVDDRTRGGGLVGRDIRANALTSADVGGLTGADITTDSLTGANIAEPSLGTVPTAQTAEEVDGTSFTSNRTPLVPPDDNPVEVLDVPGVGKVMGACNAEDPDNFKLIYINQSGDGQQQVADQRSQGGDETTRGLVIGADGGDAIFEFIGSNTIEKEGHTLVLQVAPMPEAEPTSQAVATFHVTAMTSGVANPWCRFQGSATAK